MTEPLLTSEATQMLISSVTQSGHAQLTELEAERLLNAIARAQAGVPTGSRLTPEDNHPSSH